MEKNIKQTLLDKTPKETKKKVAEYSDLMVASAILDEWIEKPENKHLGARASALKFASYYHKHKTSEQTFTKEDKNLIVGTLVKHLGGTILNGKLVEIGEEIYNILNQKKK